MELTVRAAVSDSRELTLRVPPFNVKDVYKRQASFPVVDRTVEFRVVPPSRQDERVRPVSYTHLDVYKRQI